jgi:hypothetical protein
LPSYHIVTNTTHTMNTNWSSPKTNIIAGMNDLRHALASGTNARLVRARNEDCAYPITVENKKVTNDFRSYEFSYGTASSINKIKADTNSSEFEKYLSLNYVSVFGSPEARDRYYETGICDKDNFHNCGCSHLVHVDDYIKYLKSINDYQRANMYERQYRSPEHVNEVCHFFDFYRLKQSEKTPRRTTVKFRRKLWVVEMLGKDEPQAKVPVLVHVLNFVLYPLKYVPQKSVLQMTDYRVVTYRVGDVTNGYNVQFHIPKKFGFK